MLNIDLTSIRPFGSGGVEGVAAGVAGALFELDRPHTAILVASRDLHNWARRLELTADDLRAVDEGAVGLLARRPRIRQLLLPDFIRRSRTGGLLLAKRSHRVARIAEGQPVWYPYHRTPITGSRSIVTVHDTRVFESGALRDRTSQRIVSQNISAASAVVVSWLHPYERLLELFPEAIDKTFVVPLPILNPGRIRPDRRTPRGEVRVLVPAGTAPHKNNELVLQALAELPQVRVTFTGPTSQDRLTRLKQMAETLGVQGRTEWLGYVSSDQLNRLYEIADLVIMPSKWEAASGPVFEAVSYGIPFIATEIPPIESQLSQFGLQGHLVDPSSPHSLASAIDDVIKHYDYWLSANRAARSRLVARTWTDTAMDYSSIVDWVAGKRSRPTNLVPGSTSGLTLKAAD